ncbi:hypothetical protein [Actinoplanes xinjiangensis]|uniref:hypothetical protein n=1 Tax=Actinoplanes xinjiangensis TaxID=512350 RepID=UPI00343A3168
MAEKRRTRSSPKALLDAIGAPPAPYAALSAVMAASWFPFRLLLFDRGDPVAEIIAASGMSGALWALMWPALDWAQRVYPRAGGTVDDPPQSGHSERRMPTRRGAIVGLGIGVPFFGGLIMLCLSTGRSWGYVAFFTIALMCLVAVATRNLRRDTPTSTS